MVNRRRTFLRHLSLILASVAGFLAFISLFRQVLPAGYRKDKRIKIGRPTSFPLNDFTYVSEHKLFVYRDHGGLRVVSAICTHLGCVIEKSDNGFQCPCHGSCFNEKGEVISGAAFKDLTWYRLYKDYDGQLVVDLDEAVDSDYILATN